MLKSIKKSIKYLIILIGIIVLTPSFIYLIIRIPEVQTFIVKRITSHFSEQIQSTITVGRLEYTFFNKLLIDDLLIKDGNNDTMLYSREVSLGIRKLDFRNKNIVFGSAELTGPSFSLITDSSGVSNLNRYLSMLEMPGSEGKKTSTTFSVNQISIKDGGFLLQNKTAAKSRMLIDFSDLIISGINGRIADLKIQNDSTSFSIRELEFEESKGFKLQKMNSNVLLADNDFIFSNLYLECDSSIINADHISIKADSSESFSRFVEEVKLDIGLQKSFLSSADLRYFLPFLKGRSEAFGLSGRVSGTIAELKGRNIRFTYGDQSDLECDFDFSGLPEIKDAFIYVGINSLKTNSKDIENFKMPGESKFIIPEGVKKLGNITFNGSFTGFINDFVAYGRIATGKGDMMMDVSLRPEEKNRFKIKGLVKGSNIDLGELTGKPDLLGKLSMETNLDGYASSGKKISGTLTGKIDSIEVNKYVYRNVALNGIFTEKTWDGSIKISEENIKMDLLGMFDFSKELPEFDFTLNLAESDLYRLNFDRKDSTAHLAMLLTANFRGNNIDNLYGEIKMLNSTLKKYNSELDLYDFTLKAFTENNQPAISLRTDFADADLRGYYNFGEVSTVLKQALASLMPSRFSAPAAGKDQRKNNFLFSVNFKNTDKINNFLKTGIIISEKSTLTGSFIPDSTISFTLNSKALSIKNNTFHDLSVTSEYSDSTFNTGLNSSSLSILGKADLKDFILDLKVKPDNFIFGFNWDNKDKVLNKGSFAARGSLFKKTEGSNGAVLKIGIDSSDIYVRNNLWRISKSDIILDSGAIYINKFLAGSRDNFLLIDGNITENAGDTLQLSVKGLDLSPLNQISEEYRKEENDEIPFNIKGIIDGNIFISHALKSPLIESNITARGFSLLGAEYGDVKIISAWNAVRKVAEINANNNLNGERNLDLTGFYDPASKKTDLTVKTSKLPVDALNPLLSFFASGITGTVSGKSQAYGRNKQTGADRCTDGRKHIIEDRLSSGKIHGKRYYPV